MLITMSLILGLSMVSLAYLAIISVTELGNSVASYHESTVEREALTLLSNKAHTQIIKYEETLQRLAVCSRTLSRQAGFFLDRAELYGEMPRSAEELVAIRSDVFSNSASDIAMVTYWGESISPEICRQINSLSHIDPLLADVKESSPEVAACYIHTETNINRYCPNAYDRSILPSLDEYDLRAQTVYAMARPENNPERKPSWTNVYQSAGKLLVSVSSPIYGREGQFFGIAAIDVNLDLITGEVSGATRAETGDVSTFIIDKTGEIIACTPRCSALFEIENGDKPGNLLSSSNRRVVSAAQRILSEDFHIGEIPLCGRSHLLVAHAVAGIGWRLGIAMPAGDPSTGRAQLKLDKTVHAVAARFWLVAGCFLILLMIVTIAFFMIHLLRPLKKLTEAVSRVHAGDLTTQVDIPREDEIGLLARSFNIMVEELRKSKEEERGYTRRLERQVGMSTREIKIKNGELEGTLQALQKEVAEHKQTEEELKEAKEKAEAATRAKSQFLANMSHEIRTPMNAILGFAELLENKIAAEESRRYLSSIRAGCKTLLGIINDILDFSKIEAGRLTLQYGAVNVRSVFVEIWQIFSQEAGKKEIEFKLEIAESLPENLLLDEIRMRQILLNLVGNAVKFTRVGQVRISVTHRPSEDRLDAIDLLFIVEDTGIGIPDHQKELIFEAFRQQEGQKASYGGTGLGLAITRRLVEMMGGTISVESETDKGSHFTVLLKKVGIAPSTTPGKGTRLADTIEFEKSSILVVDDLDFNRQILAGYLECPAFHIIEASNGREAIELAKHYLPDLILMDMKMPVIDGYEAIRLLKRDEVLAKIPVIAVTAAVMKEDEDMVRNAGGDGFLKKPVSKEDLLSVLKDFLPHRTKAKAEQSRTTVGASSPALPPAIKKRLPEVLHILNGDKLLMWKSLQETFIIDEIEKFARGLEALGRDYQIDMLADWANKLAREAGHYDMERLPATLAHFPVMIKDIENLA